MSRDAQPRGAAVPSRCGCPRVGHLEGVERASLPVQVVQQLPGERVVELAILSGAGGRGGRGGGEGGVRGAAVLREVGGWRAGERRAVGWGGGVEGGGGARGGAGGAARAGRRGRRRQVLGQLCACTIRSGSSRSETSPTLGPHLGEISATLAARGRTLRGQTLASLQPPRAERLDDGCDGRLRGGSGKAPRAPRRRWRHHEDTSRAGVTAACPV